MLHRKILCIILIVIFAWTTAGCWSRREVEDLAIISTLGIDRLKVGEQNKFKISAFIFRPMGGAAGQQGGGGGGQGQAADWLLSEVGNTIYDAFRNMARRSPRTLVLYHNDLILIGEDAAREGIADIIDFAMRHRDIRARTFVFVGRGEAQEIMRGKPEMEISLTEEIIELAIRSNPMISESYPVDLNLFVRSLIMPGWDAVAPAVKRLDPVEDIGSPREADDPAQTIMLQGLAVFKKNKLVGYLTPMETKGFLFLMGVAQSGIIPVTLDGEGRNRVAFVMRRSSSQLKPVIKGGRMEIEITIKAEADIAEVHGQLPVAEPKVLLEMEKEFNKSVKNLAQDTLTKVQKQYKADVLALGHKIHMRYPQYWKEIQEDWDDLYPDFPVTIKVEGKVRRTNHISDPIKFE